MAQTLGSMAGHNRFQILEGVDQGQFLDWVDDIREEDQLVAEAVAHRKAKLAGIKAAVGGKDEYAAFLRARRDAEMSGEARDRRERAYRQMMFWQNKPITDDGLDARDSILPVDLELIETEGMAAGRANRRREANPYSPQTEASDRWDAAWLRGQAEVAETQGDAGGGSEPRQRGRPPGARDRAPRQRRTRAEMEGGAADDRLH